MEMCVYACVFFSLSLSLLTGNNIATDREYVKIFSYQHFFQTRLPTKQTYKPTNL